MLQDFIDEVLQDLKVRHDNEVRRLISVGADSHDLVRGNLQGLEAAMRSIAEVAEKFSAEAD